ncbi:MAG: hypothetical protein A2V90_02075 [Gammaproteobacteria bacterium RBG_16_57_12]|nr:MAG: hypothetical protein A2V90_02075 [Gammaproteobacteria bacterium RBG_16_57_12]
MDNSSDQDSQPKSKSQLKRDMDALQLLGVSLVKLSDAQLRTIPLPEALLEAVQLARGLKANEGYRRQLQYIGKLMRQLDPEPIRQALATQQGRQQQNAARLHRLEQWRNRLLSEGDTALAELLASHPAADHQQLRQLIRSAQQESATGKPPKSARLLFKYLRELSERQD